MKFILAFVLVTPLFASEHWMKEYGYGWGWSEASACQDAEDQVNLGFESTCQSIAGNDSYDVDQVTYDRCWCWEETVNDWRCDLYAEARCNVWDDLR